MRQHPIFNFSCGLALLALLGSNTPTLAQSSYSDSPVQSGDQQFNQPSADQQAPVQAPSDMDAPSVTPPSDADMQSTQPGLREPRGSRGPIRNERMVGNTAADRGYEGFLLFQERGTNSP